MEMQYFINPSEDAKWFEYWKEQRWQWYLDLGINKDKLRWHEHGPDDLAHYAKAAFDIEYEFPFGWKELEGVHNRTDFDLSRHQDATGKKMVYIDDQTKEKFIPYIIETSAGCDRTLLTVLIDAYEEDPSRGEKSAVLKFNPRVAPIKAAILPLVKKDGMPEIAEKVYHDLKKKFKVFYDDGGSIGRRYARMDEAGTPFCITIDGQTTEDETVTIRDRDSMEQTRHKIGELEEWLAERIKI
jgi:glycyl-tRNA synthetase